MKIKDGLIGHDYDIYYNSNGHRCKELNEINFRNYLLFAGDNLSLALDKTIDKTYPHIISKELRMDYYNISVFNGGFDCTKHNLISWLYNKPKPKAIIIGFEFLNAILKSDIGSKDINYVNYSDAMVQDCLNSANYCGFFLGRKELFNVLYKHINADISTYQLVCSDRESLLTENVTNINLDNMFDHETIANQLISLLKDKTNKIRP